MDGTELFQNGKSDICIKLDIVESMANVKTELCLFPFQEPLNSIESNILSMVLDNTMELTFCVINYFFSSIFMELSQLNGLKYKLMLVS